MYYVYVLQSLHSDFHYIGYTSDLKQRLEAHNAGQNTSTIAHAPYRVIYYEAFLTKELAFSREQGLKKHGRAKQELFKRIGVDD